MTRASDLARLLGAGATILDGTTITTSDNTEQLSLVSTDADASIGPILRMDRQSASAADGDLLGKVNFVGHNDAGTPEDISYASITGIINDASDGTEDGKIAINTIVAGTEKSRIFIDAGETVFNEESADLDFRVEGNGDANALFVEGETDFVGIGNNDPATKLHVTSSTDEVRIQLTNSDSADATKNSGASFQLNGDDLYINQNESGGNILFRTDGFAEKLKILQSGRITTFACTNTNGAVNLVGEGGSSNKAISFQHVTNGGEVGSIKTASSSTNYDTSSDYRLKESIIYDFDATSRLKQLKPCRFNFKIDKDNTIDGFLAHEVSSIIPNAISGTKDGVMVWEKNEELPDGVSVGDNKLDDNGNTIPDYQSIDHSKLIPLLTKTIQELEARIVALENA